MSLEPKSMPSDAEITPSPQAVVIDTNVVLDWLVFANGTCIRLAERLVDGRLRWLATPDMRVELSYVIAGVALKRWNIDAPTVWRAWDRHVIEQQPLAPSGEASRLRCTDADDQKFVDLALAQRARWLLTRDRAVLKLARRAQRFGVSIATPEQWLAEIDAPGA